MEDARRAIQDIERAGELAIGEIGMTSAIVEGERAVAMLKDTSERLTNGVEKAKIAAYAWVIEKTLGEVVTLRSEFREEREKLEERRQENIEVKILSVPCGRKNQARFDPDDSQKEKTPQKASGHDADR